jgi:hypothetical protein
VSYIVHCMEKELDLGNPEDKEMVQIKAHHL